MRLEKDGDAFAGCKERERASVFSAATTGSAARAGIPMQAGDDDVDDGDTGLPGPTAGENAKVAWAEEGEEEEDEVMMRRKISGD